MGVEGQITNRKIKELEGLWKLTFDSAEIENSFNTFRIVSTYSYVSAGKV